MNSSGRGKAGLLTKSRSRMKNGTRLFAPFHASSSGGNLLCAARTAIHWSNVVFPDPAWPRTRRRLLLPSASLTDWMNVTASCLIARVVGLVGVMGNSRSGEVYVCFCVTDKVTYATLRLWRRLAG